MANLANLQMNLRDGVKDLLTQVQYLAGLVDRDAVYVAEDFDGGEVAGKFKACAETAEELLRAFDAAEKDRELRTQGLGRYK